MRVNVKVTGKNVRGEFCYHGDTLDMESCRQRAAFVKQAAHELAAKEETIHATWASCGRCLRSCSGSASQRLLHAAGGTKR